MSSSAGPSKAPTSQAGRPRNCAFAFCANGALAFPFWPEDEQSSGNVKILGGQKLGYPDNHQTRFFFSTGSRSIPHVGLRILFPAKQVDYASFSNTNGLPLTEYTITIKLRAGTFTSRGRDLSPEEVARLPPRTAEKADTLSVLRFTLDAGKAAQVENYGMPTVCESDEDQAIFDKDAIIDGIMGLRELCLQRRFEVIVSNYSARLFSINYQFRDIWPDRIASVYPYTNGYVKWMIILCPALLTTV